MQRVVLDTNVALDCWVFDDAAARPLRAAVESGSLRALRSAATEAEFADVIARPIFSVDAAARAAALAAFQSHTESIALVQAAPPGLHCTDPDDQVFLDLACTAGATMLVTKDKALLATARRARAQGLTVCAPAAAIAALDLNAARRG